MDSLFKAVLNKHTEIDAYVWDRYAVLLRSAGYSFPQA